MQVRHTIEIEVLPIAILRPSVATLTLSVGGIVHGTVVRLTLVLAKWSSKCSFTEAV